MRGRAVWPVPAPKARASYPSPGGRSVTPAVGDTGPGSLGSRPSGGSGVAAPTRWGSISQVAGEVLRALGVKNSR